MIVITEAMGEVALITAGIWFIITLLITASIIDLKGGKIIGAIMFFIVIVFPSLLAMFGVVALILNAK
jgi:hypothetical protein